MSIQRAHVHADILFQLIGDHPRAGEFAHPVGETAGTITRVQQFGAEMYLLEQANCPMDRFYAAKECMRLIKGAR